MDRREFIATSAAIPAVARGVSTPRIAREEFKLKYAPHFGMFSAHAGKDEIDQLRFMHDEGFRAFEDNGMMGRPVELQEAIGRELQKLEMTMGVFVAHADFKNVTFASGDKGVRSQLVKKMSAAVEVAKRVGAKWVTVVPGCFDNRLEWDYQTANVIDNLRACAEVCEPSGLVMVLESLNPWRDHPGLFLSKIPQAFMICRAVNSPSCKILDDLYHQQVTEGNLIRNVDHAWSEIAYIQVGDHPGRKEPGTGEINYKNVFRHLHGKGYAGVVGMEHGNSRPGKDGERAVIDAYRAADAS